MKISFTSFIVAAMALMPIVIASPATPPDSSPVLKPRDPVLPFGNHPYVCLTRPDSPGISNIKEGCNKLQTMTQNCGPGIGGGNVRMVKGDGISLWIGSVDRKYRTWPCKDLVEPFISIANMCGGESNGDYRAGGTAWVPGAEGKAYVFVKDG
ncbi:hypothetical protein F5Y04DRAFT_281069 [Hypomontagnella monticulosa]|nr:hypothetical protein F5Y04DRAFT_281069 [Hypomontagnella monticulosa]